MNSKLDPETTLLRAGPSVPVYYIAIGKRCVQALFLPRRLYFCTVDPVYQMVLRWLDHTHGQLGSLTPIIVDSTNPL
jgi:hypothetical protein